jgi:hypothetical protein
MADQDAPELSPYDRGDVAEPVIWQHRYEAERYGRVDFDDDEGQTIATVRVEKLGGTWHVIVAAHADALTIEGEGDGIEFVQVPDPSPEEIAAASREGARA